MNYLLITQDLVGKFVYASLDHDMGVCVEVLNSTEVPENVQFNHGLISEEEYQKFIENTRKEQAIHAIKIAKNWIKQYPELA